MSGPTTMVSKQSLILILSFWYCSSGDLRLTVTATTLKPMTINTNHMTCWVVTVISVPNMTIPIGSDSFKSTMEYRLASVYNIGMTTYRSLLPRTRRAATYGNATIQMIIVMREWSNVPTRVDLVYSLTRFNRENCTTASDTVERMYLVPPQQVADILGFDVITAAETYIAQPSSLLWVIGAVVGGLCGIFLIVWCFLYIYCKFRQMPQHSVKLSVHPEIVNIDSVIEKERSRKQPERPKSSSQDSNHQTRRDIASLQLQVNVSELQVSSVMPRRKPRANNEVSVQRKKQKKHQQQQIRNKNLADEPRQNLDVAVSLAAEPVKVEGTVSLAVQSDECQSDLKEDQNVLPSALHSTDDSTLDSTKSEPKLVPIHHTPIIVATSSSTNKTHVIESWDPYRTGDLAVRIIGELTEQYGSGTDIVYDTSLNDNSTSDFSSAFRAAVQLLPGETTSQSESEVPYGIVITMDPDSQFQQQIRSRDFKKPRRQIMKAGIPDDY